MIRKPLSSSAPFSPWFLFLLATRASSSSFLQGGKQLQEAFANAFFLPKIVARPLSYIALDKPQSMKNWKKIGATTIVASADDLLLFVEKPYKESLKQMQSKERTFYLVFDCKWS